MHHADLDIDVTTGFRFHPFEILISLGIKIATVLAFGIPPIAVFIFEVVLNATSLFNHSNVSMPAWLDRLVRLVLVTPDMHRVHHSIVRGKPTAISASTCRGGIACSGPTGASRRPATTA